MTAATPGADPREPEGAAPRRLRRAEAVLARRSGRILLVLERCADSHNHQAVLRTAEGFGVQNVWIVEPDPRGRRLSNAVTKGAWRWLSIRRFPDSASCLAALAAGGRRIWATDLGRDAEPLQAGPLELPPRLAVVIGREADGVGPEFLAAAERRLYLPMHGFSGSFNLSVAAALLLQRLFDACPEARGDLDEAERARLREIWYRRLAGGAATRREHLRWLSAPPPPLEELRPPDVHRGVRLPYSGLPPPPPAAGAGAAHAEGSSNPPLNTEV